MIKLPPRYIPLPSNIVYCHTIPSEEKDFFGMLYGLAWESKYKFTPELPITELHEMLGLEYRTYRRYVDALERLSWLRSETHRNGCVRFLFPEQFPIPSEKVTGKQLNDKNVTLSPEMANMTNLSFSRDDDEDDQIKDRDSFNRSSSIIDLLQAVGVRDVPRVYETVQQVGFELDDILANTAYCYNPSNNVKKPASVLPMHIASAYRPDATYYTDEAQLRFIPEVILDRAKLLEPKEQIPEEHDLVEEIQTEPQKKSDLPNGKNLSKTWQDVLRQLELEIPRGAFLEHVANATPLEFRDQTVIIMAKTQYSAAWLNGRLTSTVERLLTGMINSHVSVCFVSP